jgi:hypothetical protein
MRIDRETNGRIDDETNMTKLIVSFSNFTSTSEKAFVCFVWIPA